MPGNLLLCKQLQCCPSVTISPCVFSLTCMHAWLTLNNITLRHVEGNQLYHVIMDESNVLLSLLLKSMDQELTSKRFTKQEGCIFLHNTIKSQHYRSNVQLTILRKMIIMSPLHLCHWAMIKRVSKWQANHFCDNSVCYKERSNFLFYMQFMLRLCYIIAKVDILLLDAAFIHLLN